MVVVISTKGGWQVLRRLGILVGAATLFLAPAFTTAQHDQADKQDGHAHEGHAHGPEGHGHGEEAPDIDAMMKAIEAAGTPGGHHAHLANLEGDWVTRIQMWMSPEGPPEESSGSAHNKTILGGRFVQMDYRGEFMGRPFFGVGIDGFDNVADKHVGVWLDSASTMILSYSGDCSDGGNVLETMAEFIDPMSGQPTRMKTKTTVKDEDHYVFEAWNPGPDGEFHKSMQIDYSRKS